MRKTIQKNNRLYFLLLLFIPNFIMACTLDTSSVSATYPVMDEEYHVWSSFIKSRVFRDNLRSRGSIGDMVIDQFTNTGYMRYRTIDENWDARDKEFQQMIYDRSMPHRLRGLKDSAYTDFKRKNIKSYRLSPNSDWPSSYPLFDIKKMNEPDALGGWDWGRFYDIHPNVEGLISLSRVGFDAEISQAIFYFRFLCSGHCGYEEFVLMEKTPAGWMEKDSYRMVEY